MNAEHEREYPPREGPFVQQSPDGLTIHWLDGKKHRDDGPAYTKTGVDEEGWYEEWWQHGEVHRDDGPAIIASDGSWEWYSRGKKHREGAPAAFDGQGGYAWYCNGQLHRLDGPAITYADGRCSWWREGVRVDQDYGNGEPSSTSGTLRGEDVSG